MERKTRNDYIRNLQLGNIVAFKTGDSMFSGKVVSIAENGLDDKTITIKTKNGSVYYPHLSDIVWIKNGSYWPEGIFNALKEGKKG